MSHYHFTVTETDVDGAAVHFARTPDEAAAQALEHSDGPVLVSYRQPSGAWSTWTFRRTAAGPRCDQHVDGLPCGGCWQPGGADATGLCPSCRDRGRKPLTPSERYLLEHPDAAARIIKRMVGEILAHPDPE